MNYIAIIIGGGIGAVLRYGSTFLIQSAYNKPFPLGTLFVNGAGALLIGFFFKTFEAFTVPEGLRFFVITGFLGGYTTFSTYSLETLRFFLDGHIKQALLNIALNNGISILCVLAGIALSKTLTGK
ncbi:MAG: fluoride efflux transporter CrcB [Spirochaetaceae bacterium]|jgi:CrcB protein|nr:fluoride efflux transporter CrcB [Spirochaetaceae bacterium]